MPQARKNRKLAAQELFDYAVKCLGIQAYSVGDLRHKLQLRASNPADVDATLARLRDIGYLDDKRFAESYAAARVANEGFGRMRVVNDLRAHRVAADLAAQAVEQAFEGKSEAELIDAYIERRMPLLASGGRIEDQRELASAYRRLRRAGFTSGPILAALKRIGASLESVEEFSDEEESGFGGAGRDRTDE